MILGQVEVAVSAEGDDVCCRSAVSIGLPELRDGDLLAIDKFPYFGHHSLVLEYVAAVLFGGEGVVLCFLVQEVHLLLEF